MPAKGKVIDPASSVLHCCKTKFNPVKNIVTINQIQVKVNGEMMVTHSGQSLAQLLDSIALDNLRGIAVAVNAEVIPRQRWKEFLLHESDEIIIIRAAQGG